MVERKSKYEMIEMGEANRLVREQALAKFREVLGTEEKGIEGKSRGELNKI